MSGIQQLLVGAVPAGAETDANFKNTVLLLPGNGTNGAQNNTFLDSSTNAFSITRNGNTTQGTFSPFSQTGWSNYFDGSGDYLSGIGTTSSFNFMHNTTALFTAECWVYVNSLSSNITIFDNNNSTSSQIGVTSQIYTDGTVNLFITYGSTGNNIANITTTSTVQVNQWTHIAFVYDQSAASNNGQIYLNGVLAGSGNKSGNTPSSSNASNAMRIGCYGNGTAQFMNGYISNFRITNSKVYTAAFTPPTAPLTAIANTALLTCQSNRFIDNSTNAFTITVNGNTSVQAFSPFAPTAAYSAATNGGSGYFDGTGDYLTAPAGTAFALSGEYTMELWFYPNALSGFVGLLCGSQSNAIWLYLDSSTGNVLFGYNGADQITTSSKPIIGQWNHIAVSRNSSNVTSVYLNGTRIGTATLSTSYASSSGTFDIGRVSTNTNANGYFSGARVVKGTAVYDPSQTTLTVPTAPPTAITNTSLLLNFTNAGITDATAKNDLETVGNAQISTTQSKFGGSSMYFDGTGDWLFAPSNQLYDITSGQYTVELWVRFASASGTIVILGFAGKGTTGSWHLLLDSGVLYWQQRGSSAQQTTYTWNPSTGVWYHIALSWDGTTFRMFIDGTSVATNSVNPSFSTAQNGLNIGGASDGYSVNGYIQDLRITKGVARYTANFTAPTKAFALQ